jgi:trk system potassium uptake protein TrkH
MAQFRPIFLAIGLLLALLGLFQAIPALVDFGFRSPDWQVFLVSGSICTFFGASLALTNRGREGDLTLKSAFILTTASWVVVPGFAALPFVFSDLSLSYTDAYFEAMSGLTTTGSTVITGLEQAPPGILIWRSLLQWLGGIGIIVMAVAILPMLQIGGMQLFRMESSETSEKALPRAGQIATVIGGIYLILSVVCAGAYWIAGMTMFDAVAHAMTTIATGGFSTYDGSVGHFDNVAVDYIASLFMVIGSLPFLLYFQAIRGRPLLLWRDTQVRTFFAIAMSVIVVLAFWRSLGGESGYWQILRYCTFNAISIITGTGYSTTDYGAWGPFSVGVFFFIMMIGGCAGSTSCGIKVFRFQVLAETLRVRMHRQLQPHGVFVPHFNRQPIADSAIDSVMSFFFLFALSFAVLAVLLASLGLDLMTSLSGAATALANVGPGLGEVIGPAGTFQPLPDQAKWLLSLGMVLGRLELFTVLVLFTRTFWRA